MDVAVFNGSSIQLLFPLLIFLDLAHIVLNNRHTTAALDFPSYLIIHFFSLKQVQREYHLPAGDFPNIEHFREVLNGYSIDKFEKLKPKMIQAVDDMLGYDIPDLLRNFRNPYER